MTLSYIAIGAVIVVGSILWDTWTWRRKPRAELQRLLESSDWRNHRRVLKELRRRGEDIQVHAPRFAGMLVSGSMMERTCAEMVLKDCYPELATVIKGYSPSARLEDRRLKAAPLLAKLGVATTNDTVEGTKPTTGREMPQTVQRAALLAMGLGCLTILRMCAAAHASQTSVGKAFLFGLLIGIWFVATGGSLFGRSRWGYLGLIVITLIPVPGLAALALNLQLLLVNRQQPANWPDILHDSVAALQLALTVILFMQLLSKSARDYVWKPAEQKVQA